jgi:hypothetical protein
LRARDIAKGIVHLLRRMHVEQADRQEPDAGAIVVQVGLHRLLHPLLDRAALGGVDRIDAAGGDDPAQRRKRQAAHQRLRIGHAIGEGNRVLDAVLHAEAEIDQIAVAGKQERFLRHALLFEPPAGGLDRVGHRIARSADGQPVPRQRARAELGGGLAPEAELDPAHQVGLDDAVALKRPRQAIVQSGRQIGRNDRAKALAHAHLTRLDGEQAARQIEQSESGERPGPEPRRGQSEGV